MLSAMTVVAGLSACDPRLPGSGDGGPDTDRPNIVFVLTDDLASNLVQYMPHVQALAKKGTSFANYTVTDSLCCPSRSSIFTGRYPHNTGIFTNGGKDGGFTTFKKNGEEKSTFATSLQQADYRTAMMGKYLNEYLPKDKYVPPGWTEWDVAGNAYGQYDYNLLENDQVKHYGKAPGDYLTTVVSGKATKFITDSVAAKSPFLLEVATFTPHGPFTPAPEDKDKFPGLTAPRGPAFDKLPADPPKYLAGREPLTADEKKKIDTDFRKRAQAVQSVDRMIGSIQDTLEKAGVADNTIIVFSSDNGFHMGEYRMTPGKQTAFDTDVNVPLIVAGPGVGAGRTVTEAAENVDLRPTFEALAGATTPSEVDGSSLVPLLRGESSAGWRTTSLVEHHGPNTDPADPDRPAKNGGNPATYEAIRTSTYTYVEYADGTSEYYDRKADPDMLNNIAGTLAPDTRTKLAATVKGMSVCQGRRQCWTAAGGK
ncbi:putative sulfatase [Actinoplanes friuliensis DSM 7358]|uniref:Putative sulfatase n=1 Tax=Actinoplanes friuliensis DSM 7358 TaxID=1246995 RepID=U5W4L1_9ACTN|nr:putative sulfatase [Actinoplanes friuliensis DSM 7358]